MLVGALGAACAGVEVALPLLLNDKVAVEGKFGGDFGIVLYDGSSRDILFGFLVNSTSIVRNDARATGAPKQATEHGSRRLARPFRWASCIGGCFVSYRGAGCALSFTRRCCAVPRRAAVLEVVRVRGAENTLGVLTRPQRSRGTPRSSAQHARACLQ
jgi:hypothetical protein